MYVRKVHCDYCGRQAEFVDSKEVYGRSYGMIYLCRHCNAYVGVHKGSDKPLGRLANAELRRWKMKAHDAFDPLWKYGAFRGRRNDAYAWLAKQMNLPRKQTHIGMFDMTDCKAVIRIITDAQKGSAASSSYPASDYETEGFAKLDEDDGEFPF